MRNSKKKNDGETITVRQAHVLIGPAQISLNALYKAIREGHVPHLRLGTRILISRRWLIDQLNAAK